MLVLGGKERFTEQRVTHKIAYIFLLTNQSAYTVCCTFPQRYTIFKSFTGYLMDPFQWVLFPHSVFLMGSRNNVRKYITRLLFTFNFRIRYIIKLFAPLVAENFCYAGRWELLGSTPIASVGQIVQDFPQFSLNFGYTRAHTGQVAIERPTRKIFPLGIYTLSR